MTKTCQETIEKMLALEEIQKDPDMVEYLTKALGLIEYRKNYSSGRRKSAKDGTLLTDILGELRGADGRTLACGDLADFFNVSPVKIAATVKSALDEHLVKRVMKNQRVYYVLVEE